MIIDCNEIILDRLWVGRLIRPEEVKLLLQMGITHVVSLQSDEDLANYGISVKKLLKAYESAGIELRRIATQDFNQEAISKNLANCVGEVESALELRWAKVYLHCTAGINRSPTVAAAYLIRSRKIPAQAAFDYVSERRHCSPYLAVLEDYSRSLQACS